MVGNVPDRNDRDAEFGIRSGIAAFDTVERAFRRERGENTIGVIEGILEIFDQFGLVFAGSSPPFSQSIEPAYCGGIGILVFRHGFS